MPKIGWEKPAYEQILLQINTLKMALVLCLSKTHIVLKCPITHVKFYMLKPHKSHTEKNYFILNNGQDSHPPPRLVTVVGVCRFV